MNSPSLPPTPDRLPSSTRTLLNTVSFVAADVLALSGAFYMASHIRAWFLGGHMMPKWSWFVTGLWVVLSVGMRLTPGWGLGVVDSTRRIFLLLVSIFAGTATALFLTKEADNTSRLTLSLAFGLAAVLVPLLRQVVKRRLIDYRLWGMRVVVFGHREKVEELVPILREGVGMGYVPVAVCLVDEADRDPVCRLPVLGRPEEADPARVQAAILVEPSTYRAVKPDFAEKVSLLYRKTLIVPELHKHTPSLWVTPRDLGGIAGLEVSTNLLDPWSRRLKVFAETAMILLFLPLALPLLLAIALLVWLTDFHNPFFLQPRRGRDGKIFAMWKFRTMRPDAEKILREHLAEDPAFRAEWEKGCKVRRDPRVTPIGSFLRATSLDELPQVLNVLRGEMSLIGPRPLPDYHDRELPEDVRELRAKVLPGMTGLWQVSGRSEAGNDGIIRWDAYYVRNWSLWLDLVILVRTVQAILQRKGAY